MIGASGGVVYVFASWLIANVLKIDDPVDAGAVHAFCGAWGLLMASAFAHKPFVRDAYSDEIAEAGYGANHLRN
jgi:ammonium transporter, Amt family